MSDQCVGSRVWLQAPTIGLHRLQQVQRHLAHNAKLQPHWSRLDNKIGLALRRTWDQRNRPFHV